MTDYRIIHDENKGLNILVKEGGGRDSSRRFAKAYLDVLARTDLTPLDKLIMSILDMLSQKTGAAWPRVDTIAAMVGASERAVRRRLKLLSDPNGLALVKISQRKDAISHQWQSNFYELTQASGQNSQRTNCPTAKLSDGQICPLIDKGSNRDKVGSLRSPSKKDEGPGAGGFAPARAPAGQNPNLEEWDTQETAPSGQASQHGKSLDAPKAIAGGPPADAPAPGAVHSGTFTFSAPTPAQIITKNGKRYQVVDGVEWELEN